MHWFIFSNTIAFTGRWRKWRQKHRPSFTFFTSSIISFCSFIYKFTKDIPEKKRKALFTCYDNKLTHFLFSSTSLCFFNGVSSRTLIIPVNFPVSCLLNLFLALLPRYRKKKCHFIITLKVQSIVLFASFIKLSGVVLPKSWRGREKKISLAFIIVSLEILLTAEREARLAGSVG